KRLRFLPSIRFGTEQYPEKVARRLRAVNLTVWIGAAIAVIYSIAHSLDPRPGVWKSAAVNAVWALIMALAPLLHRFGPLAAPIGLIIWAYIYFLVICVLHGTGTGQHTWYLVAASLFVLFVGTDHPFLISVVGVFAALLIIAVHIFVPWTTGLQSESA